MHDSTHSPSFAGEEYFILQFADSVGIILNTIDDFMSKDSPSLILEISLFFNNISLTVFMLVMLLLFFFTNHHH